MRRRRWQRRRQQPTTTTTTMSTTQWQPRRQIGKHTRVYQIELEWPTHIDICIQRFQHFSPWFCLLLWSYCQCLCLLALTSASAAAAAAAVAVAVVVASTLWSECFVRVLLYFICFLFKFLNLFFRSFSSFFPAFLCPVRKKCEISSLWHQRNWGLNPRLKSN